MVLARCLPLCVQRGGRWPLLLVAGDSYLSLQVRVLVGTEEGPDTTEMVFLLSCTCQEISPAAGLRAEAGEEWEPQKEVLRVNGWIKYKDYWYFHIKSYEG